MMETKQKNHRRRNFERLRKKDSSLNRVSLLRCPCWLWDTQVLVLSPSWGTTHAVFTTNTYRWTAAVEEDYRSGTASNVCQCHAASMDIMGVPFILFWALVVALNMAHNRFIIPKEALKFDVKRLIPSPMRKRNFSLLTPLSSWSKSLMKLFLLGYIVWKVVGSQWTTFSTLLWSTPTQTLLLLHDMVWDIFWGCIPMIVVIAIFDFGYQWYDTRKKLMMSRQELKDEMKNTDGNPEVKAQQRKRAQQRLQATINKKVPTADVVVVNPTHFAVALRYEKSEADAPVVVAKGVDFWRFAFVCWQINTTFPLWRTHPWLEVSTFKPKKDTRSIQTFTLRLLKSSR